jgi:transketolase
MVRADMLFVPPTGAEAISEPAAPPPAASIASTRMADAVRALAIDAVEAARSGDPALPLGMADAATVLWTRFLRFDAADARWLDRDRFVLSAGHGATLLYALLHLTGHAGMGIDELQCCRQLHSPAAGHPEYGVHPAIEATTGPPGQGLASAVGMALAERMMAARFGKSLVDHRTWVIASDGDLSAGVGQEAIGLAGHLRLEKLTVLLDDGATSGSAEAACSDDTLRRFAAQGWAVKGVEGQDVAQIGAALSFAVRSKKPTLIACRTAKGQGTHDARAARRALGWNDPPFVVPDGLAERWRAVGSRGAAARRGWLKRLAHHPMRAEFERVVAGRLPENWHEAVASLRAEIAEQRPDIATRQASQLALDALAPALVELVGGSAGRTGSNLTWAKGMVAVSPGNYAGHYVHYGVREHGMAACLNGLALHGGLIPYGGTFLAFADHAGPAIRLAAMMRQRVIYVLTHDSIGIGEDGPTRQPIEHLASLRAMPSLHVLRPADAMETAECWEVAIRRTDGPSVLVLTRQAVPALRSDIGENRCARGGYVLAEAEGARQVTLIATGSEVAIALAAREALASEGLAAAVVSLPCWDLFSAQDEAYRAEVLGGVPRIGIEAACGFGWERWLGEGGMFIGMTGFGASAPQEELYRHFGITPEAVIAAVRKRLG